MHASLLFLPAQSFFKIYAFPPSLLWGTFIPMLSVRCSIGTGKGIFFLNDEALSQAKFLALSGIQLPLEQQNLHLTDIIYYNLQWDWNYIHAHLTQ